MHLHSCVYTGSNSSEIHDNSIVHYLTDYLMFPINSKCSLILNLEIISSVMLFL